MNKKLIYFAISVLLIGCKNKSLSENEKFQPREIHENIQFHFDKITVDGIEYLILEKDNNNPHEGFGFMAFRANKLVEKQDTILAYLQTARVMQAKIYARQFNISEDSAMSLSNSLLDEFLLLQEKEIIILEEDELSGNTVVEEDK
jgi:hypothetical protein